VAQEVEAKVAPGAAFQQRSVAVAGFDVRYWEAGSGEPVIALHGAGGVELSLAHELLADRFRVLVFEVPGFGPQENTSVLDPAGMAAVVLGFADALGLDRFAVLATSMSGPLACRLALDQPQRVVRLILEAPAALRGHGARNPFTMTPQDLLRAFNRHPERVAHKAMPDPAFLGRVAPLVMGLVGPPFDADLADALGDLTVPTLVIYGLDDGLTPPEAGREFRTRIPQCTYALVYDAAHDVQGDRPEAFADLVGDFLARGQQFLVPDADSRINP
jgi:pimeloyl-ACP methyl ester carboxylesterase